MLAITHAILTASPQNRLGAPLCSRLDQEDPVDALGDAILLRGVRKTELLLDAMVGAEGGPASALELASAIRVQVEKGVLLARQHELQPVSPVAMPRAEHLKGLVQQKDELAARPLIGDSQHVGGSAVGGLAGEWPDEVPDGDAPWAWWLAE